MGHITSISSPNFFNKLHNKSENFRDNIPKSRINDYIVRIESNMSQKGLSEAEIRESLQKRVELTEKLIKICQTDLSHVEGSTKLCNLVRKELDGTKNVKNL